MLLLVLLAAYAGRRCISTTKTMRISPRTAAIWCPTTVPIRSSSTGVSSTISYFFPYLDIAPTVHSFYAEMLAVLLPEATRCKLYEQASGISLRAPPVA